MIDKGNSQSTILRVFFLALALVAISAAIGVTIVPFGSDPWRKTWLSSIMIIAGLIILLSAIKSPYRAGLPLTDLLLVLALFLVCLLASGSIEYKFAGGDAFHSYRGFPYRWLVGGFNPDMSHAYEWSLFWPGFIVDGFFWFTSTLGLTLLVRQLNNLFNLEAAKRSSLSK